MSTAVDAIGPMTPALLAATCSLDGTMTFRNEVWSQVFGIAPDPWSRLNEGDHALIQQYLRDAMRGQLVTNQVMMVNVPNQAEPLAVLLNFFPVQAPQEEGKQRLLAITITGDILAEPNSWITSQTQRSRMEALGRMTMGIAHDFNNLLSGILGNTELLKSAMHGLAGAASLQEYAQIIERAANDGAALVRKIQQYIRQEKQAEHQPLDLPVLIQDCVTLTRPYWYNEPRRQGIAIACKLDPAPVPPILGAASELRDVLVNLILNAVQAMPQGGQMSFRTYYDEQDGVVMEMSDTGTGMSEHIQARIFNPLFTTKGERGSGMGLAVSYGTIQAHDGTISVASELGKGTTFTLTFPPAERPLQHAPNPAEALPLAPADILIVDDEPMVRAVLKKLLALRGHTITEAASAAEALDILDGRTFDIVFTDQGMPEMNGREFATILRSRQPDVPIVLLTGDTEVGQPDQDVNKILAKPFKISDLETAIRTLLQPTQVDP